MPWFLPTLRQRREQVRDSVAAHLPGADATVPNSVLRAVGEAQASLTHDNDLHLDYVARMMMPDTAEGVFAERWANIWLPDGRKGASFASGQMTVTGVAGSAVPTGAELTATVIDADGVNLTLGFEVTTGVTLSGPSGIVEIEATTAGALGNLVTGAQLTFTLAHTGIDGIGTVTTPGLAGGADSETESALIERYIARIQDPPHGGAGHDYVAWAFEVAGVTRAWAKQEMGVGTVTVRVMLDEVRAGTGGFPTSGDLDAVAAHIDTVRPITVADFFVEAPISQPLNITITDIATDTPEVRTNIDTEIAEMLRARATPGQTIYASWIVEAISAATGEDHHTASIADVPATSAGHLIVPGAVTYV